MKCLFFTHQILVSPFTILLNRIFEFLTPNYKPLLHFLIRFRSKHIVPHSKAWNFEFRRQLWAWKSYSIWSSWCIVESNGIEIVKVLVFILNNPNRIGWVVSISDVCRQTHLFLLFHGSIFLDCNIVSHYSKAWGTFADYWSFWNEKIKCFRSKKLSNFRIFYPTAGSKFYLTADVSSNGDDNFWWSPWTWMSLRSINSNNTFQITFYSKVKGWFQDIFTNFLIFQTAFVLVCKLNAERKNTESERAKLENRL